MLDAKSLLYETEFNRQFRSSDLATSQILDRFQSYRAALRSVFKRVLLSLQEIILSTLFPDTNNHTENTQLDYNGLFDTDHDNNNGDILVKNEDVYSDDNSKQDHSQYNHLIQELIPPEYNENDRPKHDIFFSHTQPSVMIIMKLRVIMIPSTSEVMIVIAIRMMAIKTISQKKMTMTNTTKIRRRILSYLLLLKKKD